MRRTLMTATIALIVLLPWSGTSVAAVSPPANDNLANPQHLSADSWASWVDMTGATFETNEMACGLAGDQMDQSVWFAWSIPTRAEVGIGIAGIENAVAAAIYGPFDTLPTSIGDLPDRLSCINGTGPEHGSSGTYEAGNYLIQLTKISSRDFTPGMSIEKRFPFEDIGGSTFRWDITWLYYAGITRGCNPVDFCPDAEVTRGQMAAFLVRALSLRAASTDYFGDDNGTTFEHDINALAASGITKGCSPTSFCPDAEVTRGQMAAFLVRALSLPASSTDYFGDDNGTTFEHDINALAASGITKGCSPTSFCPDDPVTRGQMAAFLHRALG